MPNCITGSLDPYQGDWGKRQVQHLYNRIGYGADFADIDYALTQTLDDLVEELIDEAMAIPVPDDNLFPWAYQSPIDPTVPDGEPPHYPNSQDKWGQMRHDFLGGLIKSPVRYKLTLFWHNHFVTETPEIRTAITYLFLYYRLLHEYSFGNFKTFTEKMGLNPYMLIYLNGRDSRKEQPNENYPRELLELFTIGEGNYLPDDIENVAKALTGWKATTNVFTVSQGEGHYAIYPDDTFLTIAHHDFSSSINLFGQFRAPSGAQTKEEAYNKYLWVHDVIFTEKAIEASEHICRKLYKYYVYEEPDETTVSSMAETLRANDWQIHVVLRQLFKSEHFFSTQAYGANIKSPLELFAAFYKQTGLVYNTHWFNVSYAFDENFDPNHPFNYTQIPEPAIANKNNVGYFYGEASGLGQRLFFPPSVAGWPGGQAWISEFTLVNRWEFLRRHITYTINNNDGLPVSVAVDNHYKQIILDISEDIDSVYPDDIVRAIIAHYMIIPPNEEFTGYAIVEFKDDIPINYIEDETWIHREYPAPQFKALMRYLIKLPEFQLS